MARTTLSRWQEGTRINLERSLKLGDELGGHLVFGHVDGVAELAARRPEGDSLRLAFRPPGELLPFVAVKGSVTLQGVSLTVNEVEDGCFGVNLIPNTQSETTLGSLATVDCVNQTGRGTGRERGWQYVLNPVDD